MLQNGNIEDEYVIDILVSVKILLINYFECNSKRHIQVHFQMIFLKAFLKLFAYVNVSGHCYLAVWFVWNWKWIISCCVRDNFFFLHNYLILISSVITTLYSNWFSWLLYSENVGLIGLTRVGSRRAVQISAGFMIFFSVLG